MTTNATTMANTILAGKSTQALQSTAQAFAPSNIALVKYWGKRDCTLNLPCTNSLSVALGTMGATTKLETANAFNVILNNQTVARESHLAQGIIAYLSMLGIKPDTLNITINMNIPIAAGLASSACGFASLIKTLDLLYKWGLSSTELSILARLGSGSASRSLWPGFVEWQKGVDSNGMDSHGIPLATTWPQLRIGLIIVTTAKKSISSRLAMQRTIDESILYRSWASQVAHDLPLLKNAICAQNFDQLGAVAEANACAMHATMMAARPAIVYSNVDSIAIIHKIKTVRDQGISCYFTQDAGPNIKLLFQAQDQAALLKHFPQMTVVEPFQDQP